jgi:hypothetical protein
MTWSIERFALRRLMEHSREPALALHQEAPEPRKCRAERADLLLNAAAV